MISNCGIDERGRSRGGKAGDQTKKEYRVKSWYNKPWDCVLRPATAQIGATLADIAEKAAKNDKIGYDQSQRYTYFDELKKAKWHPEKIKKACEADCSSSTAANVIATGYRLGIKKLQNLPKDSWTGNLRGRLKNVGFRVLTAPKYLTSDEYLLPGDILLNDSHHVAINLTKGGKAKDETYQDLPYPTETLKKGSIGEQVKKLQRCLNKIMKTNLVLDGSFGDKTDKVVRAFQKKYKLAVDGSVGPKTRAKIKELMT